MSGKASRKKRKQKKSSSIKKVLLAGIVFTAGSLPVAADADVLLSVYPHISAPVPIGNNHGIEYGIGGGARLSFRPIKYVNLFLQGDYQRLSLPLVDPITLMDGAVGAGYHIPIGDHFGLDFNANVGVYRAKYNKTITGITAGAGITFTYRINPVISTDVSGGIVHYAAGKSGLMTGGQLSPGVTINLREIFSNTSNVSMETGEIMPVFPVLYSWYETNSFGKVYITNDEDSTISDVTVSFYQPEYMGHSNVCRVEKKIKSGETIDVDLTAFFNEQMLNLTEKNNTLATVTVDYSCLGQKKSKSFGIIIPVYGRNSMSWEDDRRAAVFVSSKDPAAMLFSKYVTSIVRNNVRNGVPQNIQYAMGIFEALDQFGLNYVIDPTSAYSDNVGSSSIDFLQFPYQTLMYRGGDCDDISILVCSLFEAVGIDTAFITVPGHIYMAFDSGLSLKEAKNQFTFLNDYIILDDEVWVPLEITLTDEGFNKAWRVGAREWNVALRNNSANIYKMKDSWMYYRPVSVPGVSAKLNLPEEKIVAKLFDNSVNQWILKEIEPQIAMYEAVLSVKSDVNVMNNLGVLYGRYGMLEKADEYFKQARRAGYLPAILNTGNVYFSNQDYERARKWYEEVLKKDPENTLAILGIARCAYETGDYDDCDKYYDKVVEKDSELAAEYTYLGSFVFSNGRSFSLADRLNNTVWVESADSLKTAPVTVVADSTVVKESEHTKKTLDEVLGLNGDFVVLVPDSFNEESEEDQNIESGNGNSGSDGDDDSGKDTADNDIKEIAKTEEPEIIDYGSGLLNELKISGPESVLFDDFGRPVVLLNDELPVVADSDLKKESVEEKSLVVTEIAEVDVEVPEVAVETKNEEAEFELVERELLAEIIDEIPDEKNQFVNTKFQENEPRKEVEEDIIVNIPEVEVIDLPLPAEKTFIPYEEEPVMYREVPRFTPQPSEKWGVKEEVYKAETIPGLKSYEEELGIYDNEKAFLYEEKNTLVLEPDHDVDTAIVETKVVTGNSLPDADPFASFLSKEDAKEVAKITNYDFKVEKAKEIKKQPKEAVIPQIKKVEEKQEFKKEPKTEVTEVKKIEAKVEAIEVEKAEAKVETLETAKNETKVEAVEVAKAEDKVETIEVVKAETKVEAVEVAKIEAKVETVEAAKSEAKVEAVEVAKAEAKVETGKTAKTETKVEAVEVAKIEAKVETVEAAKSEAKVEAVEVVKAETKVEAVETAKTETKIETIEEKKKRHPSLLIAVGAGILCMLGISGVALKTKKRREDNEKK